MLALIYTFGRPKSSCIEYFLWLLLLNRSNLATLIKRQPDAEGVDPMKQVVIENPVLNSPFKEPGRHWRFTDEGITNEIVEARRTSSYFVPIAQPKRRIKDQQMVFDTEWTKDRIEENKFINRVRARVTLWREGGYVGLTKTTQRLLEYWTNPQRENKLFLARSKH